MFTGFILGLIVSVIAYFLFLKPKLNYQEALNEDVKKENAKLEIENQKLSEYHRDICTDVQVIDGIIESRKRELQLYDKQLENSKSSLTLLNNTIAEQENSVKIRYEQAKKDYTNEYLKLMQDSVNDYLNSIEKYKDKILNYQHIIDDYKSTQEAITESLKREAAIKEQENFYKIQLSEDSYNDISLLRELGKQLQNKEVLNKVIWKSYFEKPTNDLIGRVVGADNVSGIYKITNPAVGKSYIGQAVDISARFKQHIKRGLGAETPTKNKLYPAFEKFGVENFIFEILEKCNREELNEKEKFWIDYFDTKTYGYNVTGGGS